MFGLLIVITIGSIIAVAIHDTRKLQERKNRNRVTNNTYTPTDGRRIVIDNDKVTLSRTPLDRTHS